MGADGLEPLYAPGDYGLVAPNRVSVAVPVSELATACGASFAKTFPLRIARDTPTLVNLAGVVTGAQLGKHRSIILMAAVVFAAVATPSTDPFSMLMLAIPMMVLFVLAEVICRLIDRRRASRALAQVAPWTGDRIED